MKRGASEMEATLSSSSSTKKVKKLNGDAVPVAVPVPVSEEAKMDVEVTVATPSVGAGGEWTKVEKRKKKKAARAESRNLNPQPRFMYSNTEIVKRGHAIAIDDVRDLILHLIADAPPPNWLRVDNANMIPKVVALLVPGLTPDILSLPPLPTSATSNPNLPLSIPLLSPADIAAVQAFKEASANSSANNSSASANNTKETKSGLDLLAQGQALLSHGPSSADPVWTGKGMAAHIPFIASTFSHACPTRAPGDQTRMHSVLSSFFTGPVSGEEKKRRITQRVQSEINKIDPTQYLLTLEQMIENDYPIPSYMADVFEKPKGWVETPEAAPDASKDEKDQKVYAIDCEMCLTEDGKELTRVCLIDYKSGIVVYDKLVKPAKPILDYLTRWSGITAEQLNPVTTTHAEVQAHIMRLLSPPVANPFTSKSKSSSSSSTSTTKPLPTPILLGHSLESDLKALRISHPLCIDTAIIYHHPRGRPLKPGLAWLTKKWCNREIQTRGEGGHDPEEDARACVELLGKKMVGGRGFGEFKVDWESIFERMGRCHSGTGKGGSGGGRGEGVRSAVVDHGNPGVMHGAKATTAIGCKTDKEVLEGLISVLPSHQFVFGRFMELAQTLGWVTPKASIDSLPTPSSDSTSTTTAIPPPPSPTTLAPVLSTLNAHLKSLHAALPPRTALVIFTGHSDPRRMSTLNARKIAFESGLKSGKTPEEMRAVGLGWTAGEGRELEEAVEVARRGLLFLGIKQ